MLLDQCSDTPNVPTRVVGSYITLDVYLKDQSSNKPIDLSLASEIEAIFLNADMSYTERLMTLGGIALIDGPGGHFQVLIPETDSAMLAPSVSPTFSDIEFHYVIGGKTTIVNAPQSVNLVSRLFPLAP